jgi:hypothetical protein
METIECEEERKEILSRKERNPIFILLALQNKSYFCDFLFKSIGYML